VSKAAFQSAAFVCSTFWSQIISDPATVRAGVLEEGETFDLVVIRNVTICLQISNDAVSPTLPAAGQDRIEQNKRRLDTVGNIPLGRTGTLDEIAKRCRFSLLTKAAISPASNWSSMAA
jgi:O6-methylguanine-DNA--protein-cysteine methyltransferase